MDYLVLADMGQQYDRTKEVMENVSLAQAESYAQELAYGIYQEYEGLHGILTESECEDEGIEYSEEVEGEVSYWTEEINENTIYCDGCGLPLSGVELEDGFCWSCDSEINHDVENYTDDDSDIED